MTTVLHAAATPHAPALRLRQWRTEDTAALAAAHRDPALRRWLSNRLSGEAEARRWIDAQQEGWAAGTRFSFAVLEQAGAQGDFGVPAGHVVIKRTGTDASAAEVGYWTAPAARGRGIAARALLAASAWAFTSASHHEAPFTRLSLLHAADNLASCRVAEKSGFVLHRHLPPQPPAFPVSGHLHLRTSAASAPNAPRTSPS